MGLTAEVTGTEHPKAVTFTSDDKNAENTTLIDKLREWDYTELADTVENVPLNEEGNLVFEVPGDEIAEFSDFLEAEFYGTEAQKTVERFIHEAQQEALAKMEEAAAEANDD